ncbi:50S ribosomal protein L32 [Buchnera aphidicola]|uniref:Large ribosomal subunit protein bL32 n=1 Tax=Buchnera aphidicola subsp. Cinara cedri (strain Cc) TaxID=372461 RepID=RL32_BUCCC|nr:50S ribosomal protein L32 [Buchnera aphidicola]Q057L5.1 RecName: Full=Large ribosomal subunit protein bL32; AltName: Full=50S ribosomal protein L32 [Buchnera aphidicola BCc]ABJ90684.1 50S ribosomal protein L32 [Buchnera aphidicola BCc]
MAVQKSKPSRAKRGKRRSHDHVIQHALSIDKLSKEIHIRHHITKKGYYKGKKTLLFHLLSK